MTGTVVIKYGGAAMVNPEIRGAVLAGLVQLSKTGINIILVHGGGPEINTMLKKMGKEPKFVNGLRYTDEETMEVVQMILCGKVNKDLAAEISRLGGRAVGLSGMDGGMITAEKLCEDGVDYGLVGRITAVDGTIVKKCMETGFIPVISTVAAGREKERVLNINADIAAAQIAVAAEADRLIILTDVRGLLRNSADSGTLIPQVRTTDIPGLVESGVISGGMLPKIACLAEAVNGGVGSAMIIDGRNPDFLRQAVTSGECHGTAVVA